MAPGRLDKPALDAGAMGSGGSGESRESREGKLTLAERDWLLDVARRAMAAGEQGVALAIVEEDHPAALGAPGACFVTLQRRGRLHGCIGTLEARRSLVADVAANARAAAFFDPRAQPLGRDDLEQLEVEISVLSPLEPFAPTGVQALVAGLIPHVTGLVLGGLSDGHERRATFLPSVWRQIPDPIAFITQLQRKAGLPDAEPFGRLRFWRYTTESFSNKTAVVPPRGDGEVVRQAPVGKESPDADLAPRPIADPQVPGRR
jgi:AmmeMemoRadiSam system protein A